MYNPILSQNTADIAYTQETCSINFNSAIMQLVAMAFKSIIEVLRI